MLKAFYRRDLPHIQRADKAHFLTFCTKNRAVLPDWARQIVLDCCLHAHDREIALFAAIVMADHAHLIFVPLLDDQTNSPFSLARITKGIKGTSAHRINRIRGTTGSIWQDESFDHILRSSESIEAKTDYLLRNPVRASLVKAWSEYPWLWKQAVALAVRSPDD